MLKILIQIIKLVYALICLLKQWKLKKINKTIANCTLKI